MSSELVYEHGRYLVLHFDLKKVKDESRGAYKTIEDMVAQCGGSRMTESVFKVPIPAGIESLGFAIWFWKTLATETNGQLMAEDSVYMHWFDTTQHSVSQRLDGTSLDPDALRAMLERAFTEHKLRFRY